MFVEYVKLFPVLPKEENGVPLIDTAYVNGAVPVIVPVIIASGVAVQSKVSVNTTFTVEIGKGFTV